MSERASPGPKNVSPRLKLDHSVGGLPGGWRVKTTASSWASRFTDVWPVNVAALQGAVIGTSAPKRP